MYEHISRLETMARREERRIVGLMSGTSLDGLDVALCTLWGQGNRTTIEGVRFATAPYDPYFRDAIREVFAKPRIDFLKLTLLNVLVAERHAAIVLDCLRNWGVDPESVDLLASHGQTVYHAPRIFHHQPGMPNATLQIGDGDHLARRTGIITVSDFRQKHVAAGGEGAPLALYGDYFLFSKKGEDRFMLNIGGIANFSFLPGNGDAAKAFATDTGPGNTLLDAFVRKWYDQPYDIDGKLAAAGRVDAALLAALREHPYFRLPIPKTTGPETFSTDWVEKVLFENRDPNISRQDVLATLARLTVESIAEDIRKVPRTVERAAIYLSGGGAHNPVLAGYLQAAFPGWKVRPIDVLGIDGDAKEAVLFAVLANETVAGKTAPGTLLGGVPLVSMGKISLPG